MKRYPRKMPKEHKNLDLLKPLLYENLGGDNDPCFGNYSAKDEACKRCGDSEVCGAVSSNKLLQQSYKIEETQPFKDLDEGNLVDEQNKEIGKILISKATDKWKSLERQLDILILKFNLTKTDKPVLIQRILKAGKETKQITFNKAHTKYKKK